MADWFESPLGIRMELLVDRLRDARQRLRLGLPLVEGENLEELLDLSAELLEEAADDVQCMWSLEMQTGESVRRIPGANGEAILARVKALTEPR